MRMERICRQRLGESGQRMGGSGEGLHFVPNLWAKSEFFVGKEKCIMETCCWPAMRTGGIRAAAAQGLNFVEGALQTTAVECAD